MEHALTRKTLIILALIFAVGASVRLYKFGTVPAGLHQDEASLAYDAYSLLHYGIERNGVRFPLILPSYGSGQSGTLAAYLSMPFLALFDLTPVAGRAVNLLFGLAALPLFFLFARKIWDNYTALLAVFLLAISPWHIMQSRWGLDCNLFPPLFLLATYLLLLARERPRLLPVSLTVYGLCFYAYATAYLVVPLFLLFAFPYILHHAQSKIPRRTVFLSLGVFFLLALPIALYVIINHWKLQSIATPLFTIPRLPGTPRIEVATIFWQGHQSLHTNIAALGRLLLNQYDGWVESTLPQFGICYFFPTVLFLFLGILATVPKKNMLRSYQPVAFLYAWVLAALLLGMVMHVAIHRMNILYIALILFTAAGLSVLRRWPKTTWVIIVSYVLLFVAFSLTYFGQHARMIADRYDADFDDAITFASQHVQGNICVTTTNIEMPDIRTLYALKMDPHLYADVVYANPKEVARTARSFNRYYFGIGYCPPDTEAYVLRPDELIQISRNRGSTTYHFKWLIVVTAGEKPEADEE